MAGNDDRLFLITGATGKTGATSVHLLLERGYRVRALVHRQDGRSEALAAAGAILGWGRQADHGVLRLPFGNGHHAPVAGVDQSYAIAAILENPEPHDRQAYPLYGPVEMDHYAIGGAVSRALGIPVTYDPISVEKFASTLAARGRSAHLIQHISNVAIDYQNGIFSGTNNLIEVIGNRTPMTVEEFVTSRKGAFQGNGPLYGPGAPT